jgi:hypothetical protein
MTAECERNPPRVPESGPVRQVAFLLFEALATASDVTRPGSAAHTDFRAISGGY